MTNILLFAGQGFAGTIGASFMQFNVVDTVQALLHPCHSCPGTAPSVPSRSRHCFIREIHVQAVLHPSHPCPGSAPSKPSMSRQCSIQAIHVQAVLHPSHPCPGTASCLFRSQAPPEFAAYYSERLLQLPVSAFVGEGEGLSHCQPSLEPSSSSPPHFSHLIEVWKMPQ